LDFYCPTVRFAVELDGGQHNQSDNREHDAAVQTI
jgi:very-short-patch-repair endonuclease